MLKYRCPHCGKVAFSNGDRFYMAYIRWCTLLQYRYTEDGKGILSGCFCKECDELVLPNKGKNFLSGLFFINRICFGAPLVPLIVGGLCSVGVLHWAFVVLAWLYWLGFVVNVVWCWLTEPILPFTKQATIFDHCSRYKADMCVALNNAKYIKPYEVYGLKFKRDDLNGEIRETFSDGMVPVVFHPNQKGSLTYDVRIINKSAVPKELLETGSKFLVEDADGIFIAKGTIEKSELDY